MTGTNGLFEKKNPAEQTIRQLLAAKMNHEVGSEVNDLEYERLIDSVQKDPTAKDKIAVAIYRATFGFVKK